MLIQRSSSVGAVPKEIPILVPTAQSKADSGSEETENTWQRDRTPAFKRKRIESSPTHLGNFKKKSNTTAYTIPTQNRFDVLNDDNEDTINTEQEKPPKPEPIFVTGVIDINSLKKVLHKITSSTEYTMTTLRSGHIVKIMPLNIELYKTIREKFISDNISHYTYRLKCERPYRVVLRGTHQSEDTTEITEELKKHGHEVRQIVNVRHRTTKESLPLFYVDLEPKPNNRDIFKIKQLIHTKISFEAPYKKREVLQCKRCQRFGHSKNQCLRPFRCVKCGADHATSACTKSRDTEATCANCQEKHPASYRGCTKYKQYKEQILKISSKENQNRVRPSDRQTEENRPQPKRLNASRETSQTDRPQPMRLNASRQTPQTYAEVTTKSGHQNKTTTRTSIEADSLVEVFDKMINKFQTIMTNMMDSMMDRMIQLVSRLLTK